MELKIGRHIVRIERMSVLEQWKLLRISQPLMPALRDVDLAFAIKQSNDILSTMTLFAKFSTIGGDKIQELTSFCLQNCWRKTEDSEVPLTSDDLNMSDLMMIIMNSIDLNLGPMLSMERPKFLRSPYAVNYEPVFMPDGEDWLWRPMERGFCTFVQMKDNSLYIEDIAKMNDVIDVRDENEVRARKAV